MSKPPVRILLVDDHEVVRRGLRALIESHAGWEVCGEAANGREAVVMVHKLKPDIVVMDITMPELNGFEATRQIVEGTRGVDVLVLSMHESEQMVGEVIKAGARGYLLKSDAGRDLFAAIEALLRRETFFSSRVAVKMHELEPKVPGSGRRRFKPVGDLTRREREILQLLAEGRTNREAAQRLGISVKTAETHRARIMRKLEVTSLADLVRYAIRNGYIEA